MDKIRTILAKNQGTFHPIHSLFTLLFILFSMWLVWKLFTLGMLSDLVGEFFEQVKGLLGHLLAR